jgi:hypothetical protein
VLKNLAGFLREAEAGIQSAVEGRFLSAVEGALL